MSLLLGELPTHTNNVSVERRFSLSSIPKPQPLNSQFPTLLRRRHSESHIESKLNSSVTMNSNIDLKTVMTSRDIDHVLSISIIPCSYEREHGMEKKKNTMGLLHIDKKNHVTTAASAIKDSLQSLASLKKKRSLRSFLKSFKSKVSDIGNSNSKDHTSPSLSSFNAGKSSDHTHSSTLFNSSGNIPNDHYYNDNYHDDYAIPHNDHFIPDTSNIANNNNNDYYSNNNNNNDSSSNYSKNNSSSNNSSTLETQSKPQSVENAISPSDENMDGINDNFLFKLHIDDIIPQSSPSSTSASKISKSSYLKGKTILSLTCFILFFPSILF